MTATSTSDVTASTTTTAGNTTDGPVLSLINKRLRALRKKFNRIVQTEESLSEGKTLNSEQQELLRSKSSVLCLIDELEKLRSPLSSAVSEEISLALKNHLQNPQSASRVQEECVADDTQDRAIKDLLNLMYFGSLFDVMPQREFTSLMLTRTHERGCCLTYDYVTDDATDLLGEMDLDLISALKGLMISRPVDSSLSHKNALQRCIEHAKLWLANSDQPIDPDSNVTYAGLREKLNKIMSSDYYTTTPQMKVAVEMAAAAAAGNFGSFQVPVMPVSVPVQVEEPVGQYQETEENTENYEEYKIVDNNHSEPAEEFQKGNVESENPLDEVFSEADHTEQQVEMEESQRDTLKEQQYVPRRNYQNQRGGRGSGSGRRGYPNGRGGRGARGGGPYQNGRNQFYEQTGNYYPRNYYYTRGRGGGRGGGGVGGSNHHSHASAVEGGHAHAKVGLAS
ncbi:hypothetical protein Nepgr_003519 [Nepenthes gracilis]|uniref:Glycine-rich protein n=1 Tax=Nepenthes gracilis TaxID=150966 RepID=A0AAD3XDX8_NEPGR|nr:hypothetical protein Nepgr_003519 [Nepenthes gracilis]